MASSLLVPLQAQKGKDSRCGPSHPNGDGTHWLGCRSGELTATVPDPNTNGGPKSGTIATAFDCVTGPALVLIGRMDFLTGSSGCLSQVQSVYPLGNHVLDCSNGADYANPGNPCDVLRFGRVCVSSGGIDGCDPRPNLPPICNAGGPYSGTVGTSIQFNGTGSSDPDGQIVAYQWTFGDGGTGTGPSPSHSYNWAGLFRVGLRVTDNCGLNSTCEQRHRSLRALGSSLPYPTLSSCILVAPIPLTPRRRSPSLFHNREQWRCVSMTRQDTWFAALPAVSSRQATIPSPGTAATTVGWKSPPECIWPDSKPVPQL
jgi:hypothetical protein